MLQNYLLTIVVICSAMLVGCGDIGPHRTFEIHKGSRDGSVFPDGVSLVFFLTYKMGPSAQFSCIRYEGDLQESGALLCREVWADPEENDRIQFSDVPKLLLAEPTSWCKDPVVSQNWQGFDSGMKYYFCIHGMPLESQDLSFLAIDEKRKLLFSSRWVGVSGKIVLEIDDLETARGSRFTRF